MLGPPRRNCFRFPVVLLADQGSPSVMQYVVSVKSSSLLFHTFDMRLNCKSAITLTQPTASADVRWGESATFRPILGYSFLSTDGKNYNFDIGSTSNEKISHSNSSNHRPTIDRQSADDLLSTSDCRPTEPIVARRSADGWPS